MQKIHKISDTLTEHSTMSVETALDLQHHTDFDTMDDEMYIAMHSLMESLE